MHVQFKTKLFSLKSVNSFKPIEPTVKLNVVNFKYFLNNIYFDQQKNE